MMTFQSDNKGKSQFSLFYVTQTRLNLSLISNSLKSLIKATCISGSLRMHACAYVGVKCLQTGVFAAEPYQKAEYMPWPSSNLV